MQLFERHYHIITFPEISFSMKKFLTVIFGIAACACVLLSSLLTACKRQTDYFRYVSEYRKSVYFYSDDKLSVKIYSVDRETPYSLDGIKGETNALTEVYVQLAKTADEVEAELLGQGGEMSYLAVTRNYYLSFSGTEANGASVDVKITVDGTATEIKALNVAEEGTIDGKPALKCVLDYDGGTFSALTDRGAFAGEIYIRLLYDEGCFYYVGVCDRDKNVHAYLVSGTDGRVIAEREMTAE